MYAMKLIDADAAHLRVELTPEGMRVLSGMMDMIARCPNPIWEDSGSSTPEDCLKPEEFEELHRAWQSLCREAAASR